MVKDIEYRYELKFVISDATARLLKQQLKNVMYMDSHSISDEYSYDIRSIYFDDTYGSAYRDKVNGEEYRYKYRIRMYNNDPGFISLECKHKDENMTYKESCRLSEEVARALINKQYLKIKSSNPFMNRFLADAGAHIAAYNARLPPFEWPPKHSALRENTDAACCAYSAASF